jgi:hypothetical protein
VIVLASIAREKTALVVAPAETPLLEPAGLSEVTVGGAAGPDGFVTSASTK